jgi:hypothetical protein
MEPRRLVHDLYGNFGRFATLLEWVGSLRDIEAPLGLGTYMGGMRCISGQRPFNQPKIAIR